MGKRVWGAMMRPGGWLAGFAVVLAAVWLGGLAPAIGQDRVPLLVDGTQSLHQRVLTRPGAVIHAEPTDDAAIVSDAVPVFSVFYVFDRQGQGDGEWLEIGGPFAGPPAGWIRAGHAVDWRQTMVLAFQGNRPQRQRVLFFDEREALADLLDDPALAERSATLRRQAVDEALPADSPVISIEPPVVPDIHDAFYLLPILEVEDRFLASGFDTRMVRVASIPLSDDAPDLTDFEDQLADFEVGVVFVIDTTSSMEPYIDATRQVVTRIHEHIRDTDIGERTTFSLVGFRDSTRLVPALDYVSRVFVELESGLPIEAFLDAIARMEVAAASSVGFDEESMAGLHTAIDFEEWDKFGGRYIILITDAGPRRPGDADSATRLGPREINSLAQENGIAILTLHLLSEEGADNHAYAEAAYRAVSAFAGIDRPFYFPVREADVAGFTSQIGDLARVLIGDARGRVEDRVDEVNAEIAADVEDRAQLLDRVMQLAYLGRVTGAQAPDVFDAWTADVDMTDPSLKALQVRVLLTKSQLSDLTQVLEAILEAGSTGVAAPEAFFGQLRSAVAHMARNPDLLPNAEFESLGQLMGEYLDGLPYRSQLMEIGELEWLAMGPGAQLEMLDRISAKIELYRQRDADDRLWHAPYDGAQPSEYVYAMPLEDLP